MARLRFRISMSLDGYVAGLDQSIDNPLGVGGMRLHEWIFGLRTFRREHGLEGGDDDDSTPVVESWSTNIGATIMGRNMFGGHPGAWKVGVPWTGWWGLNPPFHHPVFVLTHHAREPLAMEGGTTFTFVTDGIQSALDQARRAAGDRDIMLGGGAQTARAFLAAGHVDEMEISLVPVLLGSGERLFDRFGDDMHGLQQVRVVAAPGVTHIRFERR